MECLSGNIAIRQAKAAAQEQTLGLLGSHYRDPGYHHHTGSSGGKWLRQMGAVAGCPSRSGFPIVVVLDVIKEGSNRDFPNLPSPPANDEDLDSPVDVRA